MRFTRWGYPSQAPFPPLVDGAASSPAGDHRWLALRQDLESIPQSPSPREHPRNWLFRVKRAMDFVGHNRRDLARFFARVNPYPKPFEHIEVASDESATIAAWYGPSQAPSDWGIVIVPGMFGTKDDTAHKRRSLRIWRQWKIPILVMDLRGFGESTGISTGGWKEAIDVLACAKELQKRSGVKRVAVLSESLGGAAALNALALDGASGAHLLSGGVVACSPFVDARDAVAYISEKPPGDHPFALQWLGFRRLLRLKSMGGYERFDDYLEDAARVHGLADWNEMADLANPKWKVPLLHQPTLLIHAADDPVVPIRHARRVERYADANPLIQVLLTEWGGHTGFEPMDPHWFWEVLRRFYGEVNHVELPNLASDSLLEP